MAHIKLNQGLRRIEVSKLEIENDLAFEHFDRLPADQRDAEFVKALYIGVLALRQDRLAAFMARTAVMPASCSFKTPIICSSLNLLRFIRPAPCVSDSTHFWSHFRGARQYATIFVPFWRAI